MRLGTFNILNGRDPGDDTIDVDRLTRAVSSLDADVLALQEVDQFQERSSYADLTTVAAEAMGASEHRFVAALAGTPGATWVAATGAEQPEAAAYGIALLSRLPVSSWQVLRLPTPPAKVPMWFRGHRLPTWVREEPRVAVAAVVEGPGGPLTVATTHLSFVRWWNAHQLRFLVRRLSGHDHPVVLMGDLNMGADRAARSSGYDVLARHPTFPVDDPREQLDHVLSDRPLRVQASRAPAMGLSDHRALVVDLP